MKISLADNNWKLCQELTITELRSACIQELAATSSGRQLCLDLKGDENQFCTDSYWHNQAIATADIKLCENIKHTAMNYDCLISIKNMPVDSDKDGLVDSEEINFGTNSFDKDTDNDGVGDYTEIYQNHTNPRISDLKK